LVSDDKYINALNAVIRLESLVVNPSKKEEIKEAILQADELTGLALTQSSNYFTAVTSLMKRINKASRGY